MRASHVASNWTSYPPAATSSNELREYRCRTGGGLLMSYDATPIPSRPYGWYRPSPNHQFARMATNCAATVAESTPLTRRDSQSVLWLAHGSTTGGSDPGTTPVTHRVTACSHVVSQGLVIVWDAAGSS